MSEQQVHAICATLPDAVQAFEADNELPSWKIGGKMFACYGHTYRGVCVKTPHVEAAQMLIDAGVAIKAPYFHKSWVMLPPETDAAELRHRPSVSYGIIRNSLTKKAQAALAPWDQA